jgi:DNA-binding response OmpR family regulator
VLRLEGFGAEFAHSGELGLEMIRSGTYALVILDLRLPGRSGEQVLKDLHAEDLSPAVLVMTGCPLPTELNDRVVDRQDDEVLELADGMITKPFDIPDLLDLIRTLLA